VACPKCGSEKEKFSETYLPSFSGGDLPYEVAYGDVSCADCGTALGSAGWSEVDLATAQLLFRAGMATGGAFRVMRKALRYRSQDLATLLEVRPETLSHWEHGKRPVDRGAWLTLGALLEDCIACRTTMQERLLASLNPQAPKGQVRIEAPIAREQRVFPGETEIPAPPQASRKPSVVEANAAPALRKRKSRNSSSRT
jgi:hypothetical protein